MTTDDLRRRLEALFAADPTTAAFAQFAFLVLGQNSERCSLCHFDPFGKLDEHCYTCPLRSLSRDLDELGRVREQLQVAVRELSRQASNWGDKYSAYEAMERLREMGLDPELLRRDTEDDE